MAEIILEDNLFPNLAVIDLEASGLHTRSFPIEVGWAFGDLRSSSFLIRPHELWTEHDWSLASEKIHGISLDHCREHGVSPEDVAMKMNLDLHGVDVLTDAYGWDGVWIRSLYQAAEMEPTFTLRDYDQVIRPLANLLSEREYERINRRLQHIFSYTHRAGDDARHLMAKLCACKKPGLVDRWLREVAG